MGNSKTDKILYLNNIGSNEEKYWLDYLKGFEEKTIIPYNKDSLINKKIEKQEYKFKFDEDLTLKILDISKEQDFKIQVLLIAGISAFLSKYVQSEDISIGTSIHEQKVEDDFLNTVLCVRNQVNGEKSFKDIILSTKDNLVNVIRNQNYPVDALVQKMGLNLKKNESFPLFDIGMLYENIQKEEYLNEINYNILFSFSFEKESKIFKGKVKYNSCLYSEELIKNLVKYYKGFFKSVISNLENPIDSFSLISSEEKEELVNKFNDTAKKDYLNNSICELFVRQCLETPDNAAVEYNGEQLSYKELNIKSNAIANYLIMQGVGENSIVGIMLDNSIELIISILGVLKTGACYMPIDTNLSKLRIEFMMKDGNVNNLITDTKYVEEWNHDYNIVNIKNDNIFSNGQSFDISNKNYKSAYIIYTSGSTGNPKGVIVNHESIANYINWASDIYNIEDNFNFPLYSSISFDLTKTSIYVPLLTGGKIIIYDSTDIPETFNRIFDNKDINIIKLTPAHLKILDEYNLKNSNVRKLIIGGDQLKSKDCRIVSKAFRRSVQIYNEYGPTEATVGCMIYEYKIEDDYAENIPIGKPISNSNIYLFDNKFNVIPKEIPGEIYIGGNCLAEGYLNRVELTSEKFINTSNNHILYKTGDKAFFKSDGNLEFVERIDNQIKIRGYRIELGEIEKNLLKHDLIKDTIVVDKLSDSGEKYLCAYIILHDNKISELNDILREFLKRKLPEYMIPSFFVIIENLPLTINGKVDKEKLPEPRAGINNNYIAPRNKTEKQLASIWAEVLNIEVDEISINSNFFDLGGNSLLAIKLLSRINHEFSTDIDFVVLFSKTTIQDFGKLILRRKIEQFDIANIKEILQKIDVAPNIKLDLILTMNLPYTRVFGGANKSNKYLVEEIAQLGHNVKVVTPALAVPSDITSQELLESLKDDGMTVDVYDKKYVFDIKNVEVHAILETDDLKVELQKIIKKFQPDWIFISAEDPSQQLLKAIHEVRSDNIIYLAHTPQLLPFGPESLYPGKQRTELIGKSTQIVTISEYVSNYVKTHTGFSTFVNHPPHFGNGIFPKLASFDNEYVFMFNPCDVKGIKILLTLAKLLPEIKFAIVPGWGTTPTDMRLMNEVPNITIMENKESLNELLANVKILLMPTLWAEGFGMACTDAMLRGIPVLASQHGGLIEAKLETDYLIPINHIKEYKNEFNENSLPQAIVPEQEIEPWIKALKDLYYSKEVYEKQSSIAKIKAEEFVSSLSVEPFIRNLQKMLYNDPSYTGNEYKIKLIDCIDFNRIGIDKLNELIDNSTDSTNQLNYNRNVIPKVQDQEYYEVSYSQKQLLLIDELSKNNYGYIISNSFILEGEVDAGVFGNVFNMLINRHESFRTVFAKKDGQFKQKVLTSIDFEIEECDFSKEASTEKKVNELIKEAKTKRFDLYKGPLLRSYLIKIEEKKYVFIYAMHHIISDGWSMYVFGKDALNLYNSRINNEKVLVEPLTIQYKDYSAWQNNIVNSDIYRKHKEYWHKILGGKLPSLNIPTDKSRTKSKSHGADLVSLTLSKYQMDSLLDISKSNYSTPFMTLLSLVKILLYKYTDQNDIIIGTPVSGRQNYNLRDQIGYYVNMLTLRNKVDGNKTFEQFLNSVRDNTQEAYNHQEYPFSKLVEELSTERNSVGSAFFDVIVLYNSDRDFVYENETSNSNHLSLKPFKNSSNNIKSIFDLDFIFHHNNNEIKLSIIYDTDLFYRDTVKRILKHFNQIVTSVIENKDIIINELDILTKEEKGEILGNFNNTKVNYPKEKCIHYLFEEQVLKTPNKIALIYKDERITYKELNAKANELAEYLRHCGIGPEKLVGVSMDRSIEMMICIYGILKSGAAYLPIIPDYPDERISIMLSDSGCNLVITKIHLKDKFEKTNAHLIFIDSFSYEKPGVKEFNQANSNNIAYVIYTSGSTGKPKGVMIEHHSVINRINWMQKKYNASPTDILIQKTSIGFDVSVWELFWWSFYGASLVLLDKNEEKDPNRIIETITKKEVTKIHFVPSMLNVFLQYIKDHNIDVDNLKSLIQVFASGEALSANSVLIFNELFKNLKVNLVNLYGPTEATVDVSYYNCTRDEKVDTIPIGKPIDNINLFILNNNHKLQPVGIPGELHIGGVGLARGYYQNNSLTKDKFIIWNKERGKIYSEKDNPKDAVRIYKTGDIARWLPSGDIEFLGRIDDQIKIRGFRVELGEIESVLNQLDDIKESVVIAIDDNSGNKKLVAYIVSNKNKIDTSVIISEISKKLPAYMVPTFFIQLDKIPLNTNGKADRRQLANLKDFKLESNSYAEPQTNVEKKITKIWKEVLALDKIGIYDDFFEIGGHSLNAIQITSIIYKEFNIEIRLGDFFENPNIKTISKLIQLLQNIEEDDEVNEEVEIII